MDDAPETHAFVRGHLVAVLQRVGLDNELLIRIPYHQIRVTSWRDGTLSGVESYETSWPFTHPPRDVGHRRAVRRRPGPDRGQRELERCDSAPRAQAIAFRGELERRGTGRMIRRDHVEIAAVERGPEGLTMGFLADGRRALEACRSVRDRF